MERIDGRVSNHHHILPIGRESDTLLLSVIPKKTIGQSSLKDIQIRTDALPDLQCTGNQLLHEQFVPHNMWWDCCPVRRWIWSQDLIVLSWGFIVHNKSYNEKSEIALSKLSWNTSEAFLYCSCTTGISPSPI